MEIRLIKPPEPKRYRIYWDPKYKFVCEDRVGDVCGVGETQLEAYQDCVSQLEIATSDIHQ